jgi:hypothetical protein
MRCGELGSASEGLGIGLGSRVSDGYIQVAVWFKLLCGQPSICQCQGPILSLLKYCTYIGQIFRNLFKFAGDGLSRNSEITCGFLACLFPLLITIIYELCFS